MSDANGAGAAAADVKVIDGNVLLDQSTPTGESLPVEGGDAARRSSTSLSAFSRVGASD